LIHFRMPLNCLNPFFGPMIPPRGGVPRTLDGWVPARPLPPQGLQKKPGWEQLPDGGGVGVISQKIRGRCRGWVLALRDPPPLRHPPPPLPPQFLYEIPLYPPNSSTRSPFTFPYKPGAAPMGAPHLRPHRGLRRRRWGRPGGDEGLVGAVGLSRSGLGAMRTLGICKSEDSEGGGVYDGRTPLNPSGSSEGAIGYRKGYAHNLARTCNFSAFPFFIRLLVRGVVDTLTFLEPQPGVHVMCAPARMHACMHACINIEK